MATARSENESAKLPNHDSEGDVSNGEAGPPIYPGAKKPGLMTKVFAKMSEQSIVTGIWRLKHILT